MTADPRPAPPEHADRDALAERITQYLSAGGLVNPESMEHAKVRDLLIDCRAILAAGFVRTPECASGTAEPFAYTIIDNDDFAVSSILWHEKLPAENECAVFNDVRGYLGPFKVAAIYLHPAPPPSVGATPSPEPTNDH